MYDKITGNFQRLTTRAGNALKGSIAGTVRKSGYVGISIHGVVYYGHRLAWFYIKKEWPRYIDHINGNKGDNRWANLRECSMAENQQNRTTIQINNTSGARGVSWYGRKNKWTASIHVNYEKINLGFFQTKELAISARKIAKVKFHKFSPIE
jgi:hypothetical protein